MVKTFRVKILDLYRTTPGEEHLEAGLVSIYIEDWELEIKNIPYYVDKKKKVFVEAGGLDLEQKQKDGSIQEVFIPHFSFKNEKTWDVIQNTIEKTVLKHLGSY
jgi:hypothetical protein